MLFVLSIQVRYIILTLRRIAACIIIELFVNITLGQRIQLLIGRHEVFILLFQWLDVNPDVAFSIVCTVNAAYLWNSKVCVIYIRYQSQ